MRHVFVGIFFTFIFLQARAAPPALSYQGRILRSDGTPLQYEHVSFTFQILDPSGQCVIYKEQVSGINMANSGGVFDVPIGSGTVLYPTDGSLNILDAFKNDHDDPFTCDGGVSYPPVSTDGRLLRVQFHDGSGWKLISPDSVIRSVPFAGYALSAQKLGSHQVAEFVLKSEVNNPGSGSVSCDSGNFLTWDAVNQKFGCDVVAGATGGTVTDVTASSPLAVTNGTSTPNITIQVASGSQNGYLSSSDWTIFNNKLDASSTLSGDVSGTPSTTSVDKLKGTALSVSSLSSNQVLKYSGGNWINSTLATSDISGLSTTLSGISTTLSSVVMQSQFPASCAANQTLTFVSPSGSFSCSSIAINGSQVSGNISGNAVGFTGSLAGDVSGTQGATSVDKIKGIAVAATAPTNNQVLTYTGGSWTPADLPSGILSGAGTAGYVPYYNTSTTLANSSFYYSGGKIGIGTTAPAGPLHIFTDNDISVSGGGSLVIGDIAGENIALDGNEIMARTNGTAGTLFLQHEGGLTNMGGGAQIAGNTKITGFTDVNFTDGVGSGAHTLFRAYNSTGNLFGVGLGYLADGSNQTAAMIRSVGGSPDLAFANDSGSEKMRITTGGNVGIGTTTPSQKLEVNGNIKGTQLCIGADCRSAWPSGSGGTVTSVASGTGLTGGPITGSGTLAVDVGTTANKIVQLDSSAKLPAVDGSALTNLNLSSLNASNLTSGTVPAARMPALTGDVTSTAGTTATTLSKIQGKTLTVTSPTSGDYLKYNGTAWVNSALSSGSLSDASDLLKASNMPSNCAANQTLTFSSPTGTWTCSTIANLDAGVITSGTIASARLPASATYWSAATGGINYAGGNVGIGTTAPAAALEVIGNVRGNVFYSTADLPNNGGLNFSMNRSDNTKQAYVGYTKSGVQQFLIGQPSTSDNLRFDSQAGGDFGFTGGSVGIGNANPVASAALEVSSASKGFLPPRMTAAQKNAISSPALGLMVFDTTDNKLYVYNGTSWAVASDSPAGTFAVNVSNMNIPTGLPTTKVNFSNEETDPDNAFDNVTNHVYVAPKDGFYQFNAMVNWASITGSAGILIQANGTTIANAYGSQGSGNFYQTVSGAIYMTAGSTAQVNAWQYNGSTATITWARFSGFRVGSGGNGGTGSGDNLGNHTATQNIKANGHWLSNDGDDEGAYVDTSGNVGIGTSAPTSTLDVNGTVNATNFNLGSQIVSTSCYVGSAAPSNCSVTVTCPAGKQLLSGGYNNGWASINVLQSYPSSLTSWSCYFYSAAGTGASPTCYALCGKVQ